MSKKSNRRKYEAGSSLWSQFSNGLYDCRLPWFGFMWGTWGFIISFQGKILFADETLWQWFTDDQMLQMKEAIEDHRASINKLREVSTGKIVAEADRIIDPEITLRRTVQYGLSHYPEMDKEHQYERFRKHLADKICRRRGIWSCGYPNLIMPDGWRSCVSWLPMRKE